MPARAAFLLLFLPLIGLAADAGADLLSAAKKGQTERIAALLAKGAPADATDKDGRTPLMLAAQHGHADAVKLLLEKGAKADARDRQGWTASGLAVMSSAPGRPAVLAALPPVPPLRLELEPAWSPENLSTSCFLRPEQLRRAVAETQPDRQLAAALRDFAVLNGRHVAELTADAGDATLRVVAHPGASCVQAEPADNLTLTIEVKLTSARGTVLLDKTFGGGLKGLHARMVTTPAQYGPVYQEWMKAHAGEIFWAAVEAWLRQ